MKILSQEELSRIDAHYELLDLTYESLRRFVSLQRKAIASANVLGQFMCDSHIRLLSISVHSTWTAIRTMLVEPSQIAEPDPDLSAPPTKEVLQ